MTSAVDAGRWSREGRRAFGLLLALAASAGCVSARSDVAIQVEPEVLQSQQRFRKEYVLVPGDQVEIVVHQAPELSRAALLRPDGFISVPLLDDVEAAGLTPAELDEELTRLFAGRLKKPEVTVIATQVREPRIYVVGNVAQSSVLPLREAPTALEAIAMSGGFNLAAATQDVAIIRLDADGYVRAIVVEVEGDGQPAPLLALRAFPLRPDDVIFVPERGRSQVSRILRDLVIEPLSPVNLGLSIAANFRIVQALGN
jgi:polysaccharide export outer membrane protein